MGGVLDSSTTTGPLWWVLVALGPAALVWLIAARGRTWWRRWVPLAVLVGVGVAVGVVAVVEKVWRPFPGSLPRVVPLWFGLAAAALVLALARSVPVRRRLVGLLVVVGVVVSGAAQVNAYFGAYPTVRSALGLSLEHQVDFAEVPAHESAVVDPPAGVSLIRDWTPPPGMSANGSVTETPVTGVVSRFSARNAWIYLPPAYLSTPRALLPVLVLLAGQPGTPRDWFDGGHLAQTMDTFAAAHEGLAPVVVVVDPLGGQLDNPLCVDSALGNSFTYLTVDVPAWIRAHLQVDPDSQHWSVGGLSFGGTCALQLALNAPGVYPTFADISGQEEPTLGDRASTLRAAFGGSPQAFARVNPMDLLRQKRFPELAGVVVAGRDDVEFGPAARRVFAAAQAAGIDVRYLPLHGGHSWQVWAAGLEQSLPLIAGRGGIT